MLLFQTPLSLMLTCNTKPSAKTTTSLHMCTHPYVSRHVCVCVCVCARICLSACLSICPSIHLSVSVCWCMRVCVCVLKNKTDYFLGRCVLLKMKDPKNQFCVCFFFTVSLKKEEKKRKIQKQFLFSFNILVSYF